MELCPVCRQQREMRTAQTRRTSTDTSGESVEVWTTTYHCATCNAFVRSEDVAGESPDDKLH